MPPRWQNAILLSFCPNMPARIELDGAWRQPIFSFNHTTARLHSSVKSQAEIRLLAGGGLIAKSFPSVFTYNSTIAATPKLQFTHASTSTKFHFRRDYCPSRVFNHWRTHGHSHQQTNDGNLTTLVMSEGVCHSFSHTTEKHENTLFSKNIANRTYTNRT